MHNYGQDFPVKYCTKIATLSLIDVVYCVILSDTVFVVFSFQETRSNFGNLYIIKTDFKVDANFRCEVLAENDFNTAIEIKKIKVYCKRILNNAWLDFHLFTNCFLL